MSKRWIGGAGEDGVSVAVPPAEVEGVDVVVGAGVVGAEVEGEGLVGLAVDEGAAVEGDGAGEASARDVDVEGVLARTEDDVALEDAVSEGVGIARACAVEVVAVGAVVAAVDDVVDARQDPHVDEGVEAVVGGAGEDGVTVAVPPAEVEGVDVVVGAGVVGAEVEGEGLVGLAVDERAAVEGDGAAHPGGRDVEAVAQGAVVAARRCAAVARDRAGAAPGPVALVAGRAPDAVVTGIARGRYVEHERLSALVAAPGPAGAARAGRRRHVARDAPAPVAVARGRATALYARAVEPVVARRVVGHVAR